MPKYRPRKNSPTNDTSRHFTSETQERTAAMQKLLGIDSTIVDSISGKITGTDYHFRTYGNNQVALFHNPHQTVHGKSLYTAHLMRQINTLARLEYNTPQRHALWLSLYQSGTQCLQPASDTPLPNTATANLGDSQQVHMSPCLQSATANLGGSNTPTPLQILITPPFSVPSANYTPAKTYSRLWDFIRASIRSQLLSQPH